MALNNDAALDNLTRIVQVVGRDPELQQWFSQLTQKSVVERRNEIYSASERMRMEGKDADLVASFQLLADTSIFEAAQLALQSL